MGWTVREATSEHAPIVREIARESWHAAYDDVLGPERADAVTDEWYAIDALEASIADTTGRDDAVFLLAASESGPMADDTAGATGGAESTEIVGFAHAGAHAEDASVGLLPRLYARPNWWGDGVGTALLDRIEDVLAPQCSRLRVVVLADNEVGVSFYESRGFDRTETRVSDLADGDGLEACVYEKSL